MNIRRICNELTQYGITPSKLLSRVSNSNAPKVLANSIPKSGTNLLLRALYLFPQLHRKLHKTLNNSSLATCEKIGRLKKGEFYSAHLKYFDKVSDALKNNNVKHIMIVRDPRDIAVSNCMYITYKDQSHRLSDYFINRLQNDSQRIMASIEGIPAGNLTDGIESLSLAKHFAGYMEWGQNTDCLIIKFEDLIGARGGGSENAQSLCIRKIVKHIGLNVKDNDITDVAKKIFNPTSRTFVKGQIGSWKHTMNSDHIAKVKSTLGSYLVELGYEKNDCW